MGLITSVIFGLMCYYNDTKEKPNEVVILLVLVFVKLLD